MTQELIYTSASKGLQLGSRGFCTVACTAGMSKPLADRLEALSGYKHLYPPGGESSHLNPVNYSFVTFKLGGKIYYVLSRIADAGLDYTQRSNKLAHHVVLESSELPPTGPAWLMQQSGFFVTSWEGEPRPIEPRRLPFSPDAGPRRCDVWQSVTGDAGWGGVLAGNDEVSGSMEANIVFPPPGEKLLTLVEEAQSLLPSSKRWGATFSTYYSKLPPGVECYWRFLPQGSTESVAARRSHGILLIDLLSRSQVQNETDAVVAARTGKQAPRLSKLPESSHEAGSTPAYASSKAPQYEEHGKSELASAIGALSISPPHLPPPPELPHSLGKGQPSPFVKSSRRKMIASIVGIILISAGVASALLLVGIFGLSSEMHLATARHDEPPKAIPEPTPIAEVIASPEIAVSNPVTTPGSPGTGPSNHPPSPVTRGEAAASGGNSDPGQNAANVQNGPLQENSGPTDAEEPSDQASDPASENDVFDRHEILVDLTPPAKYSYGNNDQNKLTATELCNLPIGFVPAFKLFGSEPRKSQNSLVKDETGIVLRQDGEPSSWDVTLGTVIVGRLSFQADTGRLLFLWNDGKRPLADDVIKKVRKLAIEVSDGSGATDRRIVIFLSNSIESHPPFAIKTSTLAPQKVDHLDGIPPYQAAQIKWRVTTDGKAFLAGQFGEITQEQESAETALGPKNCILLQLKLTDDPKGDHSLLLKLSAKDESGHELTVDRLAELAAASRRTAIDAAANASLDYLRGHKNKLLPQQLLSKLLKNSTVATDPDPIVGLRTLLETSALPEKENLESRLRDIVMATPEENASQIPKEWQELDQHKSDYGSIEELKKTIDSLRCHVVFVRVLFPVDREDTTSHATIYSEIGDWSETP